MKSLLLLAIAFVLALSGQRWVDQRIHLRDAAILYGAAMLLAAYAYWLLPKRPTLNAQPKTSILTRAWRRLTNLRSSAKRIFARIWVGLNSPGESARRILSGNWRRLADLVGSAKRIISEHGLRFAVVAGAVLLGLLSWRAFNLGRSNQGLHLWLPSLALLVIAFWWPSLAWLRHLRSTAADLPTRWSALRARAAAALRQPEPWLFGLLVLVAVFFRLWNLDKVPPGLHDDAAGNGLFVLEVFQGRPYTPYAPHIGAGRETLFFYLMAGIMKLVGPTVFGIKLTAVVVGLATVVAFYFFVRALFSAERAFWATFLLATGGWHITLGKVGWRAIMVPLFEVLVFYFLWRGLKSGRKLDFMWAGLALALSLNTYEGARVAPVIMGLFIFYKLITERGFLRRNYQGLAVLALAFAIGMIPLGVYILKHTTEFLARSQQVMVTWRIREVGNLSPLWDNVKAALLLFNYRGNGNDFFIEEPLMDSPVSVFFVLGLIYCLVNWRKPAHFLLLTWTILTLMLGVLAVPNGNRCIGTIPPAYTFAGLFLSVCWEQLTAVVGKRGRWLLVAAAVPVLVVVARGTYRDYLGPTRRFLYGFFEEGLAAGKLTRPYLDNYHVFLSDRYYVAQSVRFITYRPGENPHQRPYSLFEPTAVLLFNQFPPDQPLAFLLESTSRNRQIMDLLRQKFPGGSYGELMDPDKPGRVGLLALTVPAAATVISEGYQQGLLARYYHGPNWEGAVLYEMVDPLIAVHRQLQLPSFSVWWQGIINTPESGAYVFETLSDDGSYVYIDGQLVVDNGGRHGSRPASGAVSLEAGPHRIDIKYFQDGGGITMEVFWQPPRGPKEFLPAQVLFAPETVDLASLPPITFPPVAEEATPVVVQPGVVATPRPVETPVGELGTGQFILQWGGQGSGAGQFQEPVDVAVDEEGNVYVADLGNKRVQRFDANGRFLAVWEGGDQPFVEPVAVAIGPGAEIWVLDSYTNWVHRFDEAGKWQGKIGGPESGFFHARGLVVDEEGVVYVADTGFSRVVKYSRSGARLGEIGRQGSGPGEMYGPVGLAIDEEGLLYEADVDNRRLQVLGRDGRYVRAWGIPEGHTVDGHHVAVDGDWVYVTDPLHDQVLVYGKGGELIGGWGREGGGKGEFRRPMGIGVGPDGSVYVADSHNDRIQKFAPWSE